MTVNWDRAAELLQGILIAVVGSFVLGYLLVVLGGIFHWARKQWPSEEAKPPK